MTATSATDAIATLMALAQQGEIDPWDVQVIEVIDRFLEELGVIGSPPLHYQEADLPKSGQAFLWASMLVLLKAKTLDLEEDEPEEIEPLETPYTLPMALEERLRRRSSAPPPRRRRVTLQELIEQIKQIAAEVTEVDGASRRPPRPRPQSRREAVRTIASLAHNENLTEIAAQLEEVLCLNVPQLALEQGYIELEELVGWWSQTMSAVGVAESKGDRVGVFWALLLLSAQSKVELEQAEFYQDLKIKFLSPGHSPEQ